MKMWDNSAFNHNQTFLSGGGLQTETECGLLSPLCATCPRFSGHRSRSYPLPQAIRACSPDVWYGHLQLLNWLTFCVYIHASMCTLQSCYPSVCAASHWLGMILTWWHLCLLKMHPFERQITIWVTLCIFFSLSAASWQFTCHWIVRF